MRASGAHVTEVSHMSKFHERDARRITSGAQPLLNAMRGVTFTNPTPIAPDAKVKRGSTVYVVAPGTPWNGMQAEVLRGDIATDANPYIAKVAKQRHDVLIAFEPSRRNAL